MHACMHRRPLERGVVLRVAHTMYCDCQCMGTHTNTHTQSHTPAGWPSCLGLRRPGTLTGPRVGPSSASQRDGWARANETTDTNTAQKKLKQS
jgi:hypothetical protein